MNKMADIKYDIKITDKKGKIKDAANTEGITPIGTGVEGKYLLISSEKKNLSEIDRAIKKTMDRAILKAFDFTRTQSKKDELFASAAAQVLAYKRNEPEEYDWNKVLDRATDLSSELLREGFDGEDIAVIGKKLELIGVYVWIRKSIQNVAEDVREEEIIK